MSSRLLKTASKRVYSVVDWFIPARLKSDSDVVHGVRMFLFSHMFGPFLGHTISLYILFLDPHPDFAWWVFFGAITAFWPLTFVLRFTGWYVPLALISIQDLLFCILWGCYHYGGISSPILPWMITVPLLAFFYLPSGKTRIAVSILIVLNLAAFYWIYTSFGFPASIPLDQLSGLGMVSTFCAGLYVSMMALYYANIVSSQSELEQEGLRHVETARQLRDATEAADRANRAKSEFLAKMSHELRTPLNAVIGYSEMLLEDAAEHGGQHTDDLQKINGAGKQLLELVNDLLDLSKLEAGKMDLYSERFKLSDLVEAVAEEWRDAVAEGGNDLRVDCPAELGTIVCDMAKLRQALSNLVGNAAKFTRSGTVTLALANDRQWATIEVRDTGGGIGADRKSRLFHTFGEDERETSSKYEEAGLGLPLSHRLCRLMGGDLTVESEIGRGSCFTIRIPSEPGSKTADEEANAAADEGGDRRGGRDHNSVLVIDDDPAVLDLVGRMLGKEGFSSLALVDKARVGLARAREMKPAVIILDIGMPDLDGWEVLKLIREDPELRASKVVLLTCNDDFKKGRALGADAHILKPIDRDALIRLLEKLSPPSEKQLAASRQPALIEA